MGLGSNRDMARQELTVTARRGLRAPLSFGRIHLPLGDYHACVIFLIIDILLTSYIQLEGPWQ